jgi:hypothetical protein
MPGSRERRGPSDFDATSSEIPAAEGPPDLRPGLDGLTRGNLTEFRMECLHEPIEVVLLL